MQKTKTKRGVHWLARRLPFAVLWAIIGIGMGLLSDAFIETSLFKSLTYQQMSIVLVLWVDIVGGMLQLQLVERLLKQSMRGWLVFSLIGNLITLFFAPMLITSTALPPHIMKELIPLIYLAPPLILQTLWLSRRVHKPWLWGLTSALLLVGLNELYERSPYLANSPIATVLGLLAGILMGSIMHYLWSHPRDTEKAKVDVAADGLAEARLDRLQEPEHSAPLWDIGDHPTLQSEA